MLKPISGYLTISITNIMYNGSEWIIWSDISCLCTPTNIYQKSHWFISIKMKCINDKLYRWMTNSSFVNKMEIFYSGTGSTWQGVHNAGSNYDCKSAYKSTRKEDIFILIGIFLSLLRHVQRMCYNLFIVLSIKSINFRYGNNVRVRIDESFNIKLKSHLYFIIYWPVYLWNVSALIQIKMYFDLQIMNIPLVSLWQYGII